jgi:hypothetical protein
MHDRPFLEERPATIATFVGKLVGLAIVTASVIGLTVILGALLVGCGPRLNTLYLVKTPEGAFCVSAFMYRTDSNCTQFYDGAFNPQKVATFCGPHIIGTTTPENCRLIAPPQPAEKP